MWARGPPEAWFLSFGRWEDKRTAMGYAKDFQDTRVLGDLLLAWPGEGDTLEFRDLAASQVWAGVQLASERLGGGGGGGSGGRILIRTLLIQPQGVRALPEQGVGRGEVTPLSQQQRVGTAGQGARHAPMGVRIRSLLLLPPPAGEATATDCAGWGDICAPSAEGSCPGWGAG